MSAESVVMLLHKSEFLKQHIKVVHDMANVGNMAIDYSSGSLFLKNIQVCIHCKF